MDNTQQIARGYFRDGHGVVVAMVTVDKRYCLAIVQFQALNQKGFTAGVGSMLAAFKGYFTTANIDKVRDGLPYLHAEFFRIGAQGG